MVNFQDPNTVSRDYGLYDLRLRLLQPNSPVGLFDSGTYEARSRHGWYILVCFLACCACLQDFTFRTLHPCI